MTRSRTVAAVLAATTLVLAAAPGPADLPSSAFFGTPLQAPPQLARLDLPSGWPEAPPATAVSYLLLDAATGQVLAERRADELRPVASTVKVLTALTTLRRTRPGDLVTVGTEVNGVGGASVGLAPGAVWTVEQLLDGLIARSGNDAATALAVHVAGSVPAFVQLMREDASSLGVGEMVLQTPSGLTDRNRLSARQLAIITRAALADPAFRVIAARDIVDLPGSGPRETRNELLARYPDATGVKTGFTDAAGYALIGSAERGGRELVAVVLGSVSSDARFDDAAALLDFGFDAFAATSVGGTIAIRHPGGTVTTPVPETAFVAPATSSVLAVSAAVPAEGTGRATVRAIWNGQLLGEVPVGLPGEPDLSPDDPLVWGWDRVYEAMRAATTHGAWPS